MPEPKAPPVNVYISVTVDWTQNPPVVTVNGLVPVFHFGGGPTDEEAAWNVTTPSTKITSINGTPFTSWSPMQDAVTKTGSSNNHRVKHGEPYTIDLVNTSTGQTASSSGLIYHNHDLDNPDPDCPEP